MDVRSLVSGNWRTNAERAILDRNYVLYILLEQGQRSETRFPRAVPCRFPVPDRFGERGAQALTNPLYRRGHGALVVS